MKKAVILFNLGGPDSQESVEPFLFNLFNDPEILAMPKLLIYSLPNSSNIFLIVFLIILPLSRALINF